MATGSFLLYGRLVDATAISDIGRLEICMLMLSLLYILLCMKDLVCLYWKLLLMGVQYYLIIKVVFRK